MEHLNWLLKDAIKALGANKTPKAIDRVGKCIAALDELLEGERFDTTYNYSPQSDPGREKTYYSLKCCFFFVCYWL